jgi:hypothetical protein
MTFGWPHMLTCDCCAVGKEIVSTEAAPAALGPYSQAVKAGNTLYISGQLGLDPASMEFVGDSVADQTAQVSRISPIAPCSRLKRGRGKEL